MESLQVLFHWSGMLMVREKDYYRSSLKRSLNEDGWIGSSKEWYRCLWMKHVVVSSGIPTWREWRGELLIRGSRSWNNRKRWRENLIMSYSSDKPQPHTGELYSATNDSRVVTMGNEETSVDGVSETSVALAPVGSDGNRESKSRLSSLKSFCCSTRWLESTYSHVVWHYESYFRTFSLPELPWIQNRDDCNSRIRAWQGYLVQHSSE